MKKKHSLHLAIIFIYALLLAGCSVKEGENSIAEGLQSNQARIMVLNKKIAASGVEVIESDDSMMLILPCKRIFNPASANLSKEAHSTMGLIIDLLAFYEMSVVEVSGFADSRDVNPIRKVLSQERAHVVAKYLWDNGVDANFVYAEGHDAKVVRLGKGIITDYVIINFRKL